MGGLANWYLRAYAKLKQKQIRGSGMRIPKFKRKPGKANLWILLEPWRFAHNDVTRTIPAGFTWDLASVPRPLRSFVTPLDARTLGPALEHDYRYRYKIGPRKRADLAFRQALRANGVSSVKSWLCYLSVRLGGSGAWNA